MKLDELNDSIIETMNSCLQSTKNEEKDSENERGNNEVAEEIVNNHFSFLI